MARYLCNAPHPGAFLGAQHGFFDAGTERELPDTMKPELCFIPLDEAAREAFRKHNLVPFANKTPELLVADKIEPVPSPAHGTLPARTAAAKAKRASDDD